ncbi:CdaR family protein [Streptococcus cuniculipharyngis]|uniref:YbbR-like domain-containing protein n=1 Tax=Streptococcus cuniculipharyngis TaxID=1562651 RepID=A0A5C5SCY0_9STRE|nr:CdaR family protein [Streptococcus cuniculipharyngis]TWS98947.1 YbbR-like domain-containing protein [Streptococcus cuniculipharyngis]
MFKRLFSTRFSLILISVGLTLLLFLTATAARYNNKTSPSNQSSETYTYTLEHVPIDIQYDSDKYFIVGYSYDAEVYLTSTNRVKLDSEINSDTRKFKVVADLRNVREGTTKVKLDIRDLPSGMTAKVSPPSISVTIGLKKTKTFKASVDTNSIKLADGYRLVSMATEDDEVTVTSDENTLAQVSRVVAKLPDDLVLSDNYNGQVTLQAVSADGVVLPSIIEPPKTRLKVEVAPIIKTVPVKVELTGKLEDNLSNILYKLEQEQVTLQGSQERLDAINELVAKVDITGISKDTSQMLTLTAPEGVTVTPAQVKVKLTVVPK